MSCFRFIPAIAVLGVFILASGTSAAGEGRRPIRVCGFNPARLHKEWMQADEEFLTRHKVGTDSAGLIAFFRARTLGRDEQRRLETLTEQLGARSFHAREAAARELTAAGPPALSFLRKAIRSPHPEVARRARQCQAALEQHPDAGLESVAARYLFFKGIDSAGVKVLLRYLPFAESDLAEQSILTCLDLRGRLYGDVPDESAPLLAALDDPLPLRRAAAVYLLNEKLDRAQRTAAAALLKDMDPHVRLLAAEGLVRAGERVPVPVLLGLCKEADASARLRVAQCLLDLREKAVVEVLIRLIRDEQADTGQLYPAERLLRQIARGPVPEHCYWSSEPSILRRWREAWVTWYRGHGDQVEFPRPEVPPEQP
ncbi:MAG: HEAT repeat domain-containing protein [Gemmataceae bacterium]|nr:HEAT repeat domain-containing protein [Gemmataceae bacterium]